MVYPNGWVELEKFHIWCCQALPTVFTEGMSYYEVICKIKRILNGTITDLKLTADELMKFEEEVRKQFEELKTGTWIDGTIPYLDMLLKKFIPVAMLPGLTDDGYFCVFIPESWDTIQFATSGYDTVVPCQLEYGHLVMYY